MIKHGSYGKFYPDLGLVILNSPLQLSQLGSVDLVEHYQRIVVLITPLEFQDQC